MKFVLINNSFKTLEINKWELPPFTSLLVLRAINIHGGELLEYRSLRHPLLLSPFVFLPGQRYESIIDLESRFPQLQESIETNDVMIMWCFKIPICKDGNNRTGGWFLLRRKKSKDL